MKRNASLAGRGGNFVQLLPPAPAVAKLISVGMLIGVGKLISVVKATNTLHTHIITCYLKLTPKGPHLELQRCIIERT